MPLRVRLLALATFVIVAGCSAPAAAPDSTAPTRASADSSATQQAAPGEGDALLPDESAEHTIGDTILLSGGELMGDQANLTVLEAARLAEPASSGAPRYAFLVEIEGLDAETLPYNALDFSMFDDQSFEYQALNGAQQPELTYGDLPPGRKVRGWLTFLGPEGSTYLELEYAPALALEPAHVRVLLP